MSRCSCGYSTACTDEFCNHIVSSWDNIREIHNIK